MSKNHNHDMVSPSAQYLHDVEKLENGKEYQAVSLQFVDTNWLRKLVAAIAFTWSKDDTNTKVFGLFKILTILCTGIDPKYLCGSCVADGDAQKVTVFVSVKARV